MTGGNKSNLDRITITYRNQNSDTRQVYLDVFDNSLSRKWLPALNDVLARGLHLEKNYCFFGFADGARTPEMLLGLVNESIAAINSSDIGYHIDDHFTMGNVLMWDPEIPRLAAGILNHDRMNRLHRYFEDLQGSHHNPSPYYMRADAVTRWHIRQLNLLCHEFESLVLSIRKKYKAPEWQRPSQLMCWLQAPRFALDEQDYELFGVETLARPLGGVFVGVNKAVGKHHWEVFNDEGRDSRIGELTTTGLRSQTIAAADFDIEWANDPGSFPWMKKQMWEFKYWLRENGFDPEDKSLTIGHPQIGQVDLQASFGSDDYKQIWPVLSEYCDVFAIKTSQQEYIYDYRWSDSDFRERQIRELR